MARKTPKAVVKALTNHSEMVKYWVEKKTNWNGEPITEEFREGVLTGLNVMIESVLCAHSCYNGFRYVKYTDKGIDWNSKPGHTLSHIEDQTREYFIKF